MRILKKHIFLILLVFVLIIFYFLVTVIGVFLSDYTSVDKNEEINAEIIVNECNGNCLEDDNINKNAYLLVITENVQKTDFNIEGYSHIHEVLFHSNDYMYVSGLSNDKNAYLLKCDLAGVVETKIHLDSVPLKIYEYNNTISILLHESDSTKMYSVDFENSKLYELLNYNTISLNEKYDYSFVENTRVDDNTILVYDSDGVINLFNEAEKKKLNIKGEIIGINNNVITMYLPVNISKYFDLGILFAYDIDSGNRTFLRFITSQGLFTSNVSSCGKYLISLSAVEKEEPVLMIAELDSHQKIVYNAVKLDFPNSINLKSITK